MTQANAHRRRMTARSIGLTMMIAVMLSALTLFNGPAVARERLLREEVEAWWSQLHGKKPTAGRSREASANAQVSEGKPASTRRAMQRGHVGKRGPHVAANARAEARERAGFNSEMTPRRDRPGRYFLHGPRF